MSSGNRKTFDDDMSASPSSLEEASEEETPNLTGVAEENSILNEACRIFAKTVAILLGILICAWFSDGLDGQFHFINF